MRIQSTAKHREKLEKLRERFKYGDDSQSKQAQREQTAIAFENGDQWPADVKLARSGVQSASGDPATPARPTLVINKVTEPVRQILNQERSSDIGIELVPADDFGDLGITPDETEVTLREGLTRRIQRESMAADARTWAFKRAVIAGRGYYLVLPQYLPGKTFDQEVVVKKIYDQSGVVLDPSHEQSDGSDAGWEFVGTWMPWERFTKTHTKDIDGVTSPFADTSEADFMAMCEEFPEWYRGEQDGEKAVRIVDYYYEDLKSRTIVQLSDGSVAYDGDDLPKGAVIETDDNGDPITRDMVERTIRWCQVAGGVMLLEETELAGQDMPIVKVVGEEVLPYDGERRYKGMVEPAMDAQRGFNYMVSKQVEMVGLTPIPPLMYDPKAIEGHETQYAQINTRTFGALPYNSYDDDGKPLNPPTRPPAPVDNQGVAMSIGLFDAAIKSTTSVPDSTLGNVDPSLKSGKAIREVVANAAQSTSNFLDNLARSIRYEGQIINNLLYPIYGKRPGRLVRLLTGEGENETMRIGDPQARGVNTSADALKQQAEKVGKLTKDAHFNVIVKVSKNYDSRRQQESSALAELIGANPEFFTWFGDVYLKNSDMPGRAQLSDRAKVMLAPPIQKMLAAQEQGREFDPQSEAQIAQLTEQLQHAEQALQELDQIANGKKLENQTKLQIESMNVQRDVELERLKQGAAIELQRMKDATSIRVAEIAAETKGVVTDHTLQHEAEALHQEQAHDHAMSEINRAHDRDMAAAGMAHDAASGETDRAFQAEQAEVARQAEADAPEAGA